MTLGKKDFIWVVVDTLTKSDNFIPVRIDYNVVEIAKIFVKKKIVRLHGVCHHIMLDDGTQFTSIFLRK